MTDTGTEQSVETSTDLFGDALSADEQAYLDTGGASDIPSEQPSDGSEQPADGQTPDSGTNGAETQKVASEGDSDPDSEDNEIFIDEHGRVKDKSTGRFVPHAALHKERTRRREVEGKYLEAERARATVEGKIEALNAALGFQQGQQPAVEDKPIDPEEDIFGYVKQQNAIIQTLQKQLEDQQTATKQTSEFTQVQNAYVQDAVRFNKESPDFPIAYQFVKDQMHKELELQGIADPNARETFIKQEEMKLVQGALQNQRSPAKMIYDLAASRGYAKSEANAEQSKAAAEKVQTIKKVQEASASLSGKGAGPTDAGLTYEQLADMTDDEMHAFAQRSPAAFRKMMRGT